MMSMSRRTFLSLGPAAAAAAGLGLGCASRSGPKPAPLAATSPAPPPVPGADQTEKYLPTLAGKRVGLVVNQTSTIGGRPSLDVLLARGVRVVKVFGPEHGFRGNASAGTHVADAVDPATGLPVVSLYGKKRKPTAADLADVDVLVYDVQDVGVRFYTNINVLRDVMEAAAEHGRELVVLDRPNPHAYMVDGPVLDMSLKSGIGQFPVPIAHGMTVGEFARMIDGEGWLPNGLRRRPTVVPVANYTHDAPYVLPVKPSPNLNTQQSVMLYPSTCLFEGTILNHGRGTYSPFAVLGAPALRGRYAFAYTPVGIPGMSETPLHAGEVCYGLDLRSYDTEQLRRRRQINLAWLQELYAAYPDKARFFDASYSKQIGSIDRLAGVREFRRQIEAGTPEAEIRRTWEPGLAAFRRVREKYLLYA